MNARKKREARIANAHRVAQELDPYVPAALPSSYGFSVLPKHVKEVIFFDRVSCSSQQKNLFYQIRGAKQLLEGVTIIQSFTGVETGKGTSTFMRSIFARALRAAKVHSLPIVTTCFSRYLRANDYDAIIRPSSQPTDEEVEKFLSFTEGVALYTLFDPDSTPEEDRTFLSQLARRARSQHLEQQQKKAKKGSSKRRKLHHIELVFKLHKQGFSLRQIRRELLRKRDVEIGVQTLARWVGKGN